MIDKLKINIENVYLNLFLIALSRKHNFVKLVEETEEEIDSYMDELKESSILEGMSGLYFTELLARKMGSSLGEAYSLTSERREEILHYLLEQIDPLSNAYDIYYNDNKDGSIEFQGMISILNVFDEEGVKLYIDHPSDVLRDVVYSYYTVTFHRMRNDLDNNYPIYSICLSTDNELLSNHIYDNYEVWSGTEGYFADFIEKVIEEYTDSHSEPEKEGKEEKASESEIVTEQKDCTDEVELIKTKPMIVDELVTYIWDDTRTIDLLDKFEGFGYDATVYQRIVIKNCKFSKIYNGKYIGFNLVIERGRGSNHIGNITFTDFKKGYTTNLRKHVENEITEELVEQYLDKDEFLRFSKPYLLRAQNSSNRTGYGWEWDWSDGIGSYTEGTLYGETTNYFFVGAYITSGFLEYEPTKRENFLKEQTNALLNQEKVINSYNLRYYEGKLSDTTCNKTEQRYFKINCESGVKHLPVSYDEIENIYYIYAPYCKKYRQCIENGDYEIENEMSN